MSQRYYKIPYTEPCVDQVLNRVNAQAEKPSQLTLSLVEAFA